jgi:hypothetical protein
MLVTQQTFALGMQGPYANRKPYREILSTDRAFMWLAFLQPKPQHIMLIFCRRPVTIAV